VARVATSWTVHRGLRDQPHLLRPGLTVRQAAELLGKAPIDSKADRRLSVVDKAVKARDFIADPDVYAVIETEMAASRQQRRERSRAKLIHVELAAKQKAAEPSSSRPATPIQPSRPQGDRPAFRDRAAGPSHRRQSRRNRNQLRGDAGLASSPCSELRDARRRLITGDDPTPSLTGDGPAVIATAPCGAIQAPRRRQARAVIDRSAHIPLRLQNRMRRSAA